MFTSDMVLVWEGVKFEVHQAIARKHSTENDYELSQVPMNPSGIVRRNPSSNALEVCMRRFKPGTVGRFVEFMYTNQYTMSDTPFDQDSGEDANAEADEFKNTHLTAIRLSELCRCFGVDGFAHVCSEGLIHGEFAELAKVHTSNGLPEGYLPKAKHLSTDFREAVTEGAHPKVLNCLASAMAYSIQYIAEDAELHQALELRPFAQDVSIAVGRLLGGFSHVERKGQAKKE